MIISTKKYACETCIKGHRSSSCRHTDRPLFEIKKKGRPVTQCEHCRELRKTKQVHVKCVCENKTPEPSSQAFKVGFERAAFPNGLPEALEASVAFQTSAEASSSDSDHGGVGHGHQCKSGEPCNCVTPKTRSRKKVDSNAQQGPSGSSSSSRNPDSMSNTAIMKRIAELRPVLPRPTSNNPMSSEGPVHVPSAGNVHAPPQRHHKSGQAPYELAYGMTHQHPLHHQSYVASPPPSNPTFSFNDQHFAEQMQMMGVGPDSWTANSEAIGFDFPSLCGCGDDCNCPGCLHHNRATSIPTSSAYASCMNPGACGTCLDCTIMSLPASALLPVEDTALSIPNAQHEPVAEWLRQVSASESSSFQQNFSLTDGDFQRQHSQWGQPSNMGGDPSYMSANLNYGSFPSGGNIGGSFPPQGHRGHRSQSSLSNIDPRLLPPGNMMGSDPSHFLRMQDPSRSRSPSTSSQSSHQGSESGLGSGLVPTYGPSGRQQGMFANPQGVRQSGVRPIANRGPPSSNSASSVSPPPN